jgi:hypothetical protein
MVSKIPILPHRVRHVPAQFSWLDHRLVRERFIDRCTHAAAALYLFLVTVADAAGMSYYGDASIGQRLSMDTATLQAARDNLVRIGLIAWKRPLYQVLCFENRTDAHRTSMAQPASLADILKKAAAGGAP